MNKIARLKPLLKTVRGEIDLAHAYVRETPNGRILGSIAKGEWVQLPGTPNRRSATIEWTEIWFPERKLRGWVASRLLEVRLDPEKDTGETVHERQVEYEKTICFPKTDDILDTKDTGPFRWCDFFVAFAPFIFILWVLYYILKGLL